MMLTGPIHNEVDQIWNAFFSGGMSEPSRGERADHLANKDAMLIANLDLVAFQGLAGFTGNPQLTIYRR